MIRVALLLGLTASLTATFGHAQNRPVLPADLTLSRALEIAFLNSSTIRQAQAELQQATGRYEQSRSQLLPQVNVGARQAQMTVNLNATGLDLPAVPKVIGPFGSMDVRLGVSQDLLNIASLRSWHSYGSRRDSSHHLVRNAREVVTLNVVGAYLEALRAKATRDTLIEQTRLATDLYRLTDERFRQGVSSELDANRAKQQVNSLEQQRQEAEQSYVATKLNLARILQATITDNFDVTDEAAYGAGTTMDRDFTVQAALSSRPDYRAAEATVRAAEQQVASVRATRLPVVRMGFDNGQSGDSPVHNYYTYRLQGSVHFPIFTGGRIRGEIHEAEGALRDAMASLDENRAAIETEVLTAISGVEWAIKQLETSGQNVVLSRKEVDLSRERFVQGVADNTEVVNAQDRLSRADDARIRAQYTLGLARANLARAVGNVERAYRK
jgi:outer membrane protein TolC